MGKQSLKYIIDNNLAVVHNTVPVKLNIPVSNNFIVDNFKDKPLK